VGAVLFRSLTTDWLDALLKGEKTMLYRVSYGSMTAHYGPSFIEAESEYEARRKFAGTAFSRDEMGCITARPVSSDEVRRALQRQRDAED
jgi:hypothetical protein